MFRQRHRQSLGLGIIVNQRGIALAQSNQSEAHQQAHPAWHWHANSVRDLACRQTDWPDPHCLRWARQRSGFVAASVAMALPPAQLLRFTFPVHTGMGPKQLQAHLQALLTSALPWPVSEALWDYQLIEPQAEMATTTLAANRPAWLNAALQAQPSWQAEVLAIRKAWAQACEQWCRQAGLRLVKLEPEWQASMRWQTVVQNSSVAVLQEPPCEAADALTNSEWAVLCGLALGVGKP